MRVRGKRCLLNAPGFQSTGALVAEVADTSKRKPGCDADGEPVVRGDMLYLAEPEYVMLQFSDCTRSVNYMLEWRTAYGRRASLAKVDRMIDTLIAFRDGLVVEQRLYVERVRLARPAPKVSA